MIKLIIRRPVLVSMFLVGFCLLGVVSYTMLPVELIPYAELPMLIVQVASVRDADPNFMEQQSVVQLESAIAGLEDIERIESYIDRRRAMILVYYNQHTDLKYAYLKLQQRIAAARSNLGEGFFATVWKIDTEQLANRFMTLQARGEGRLDQILGQGARARSPILRLLTGILQSTVADHCVLRCSALRPLVGFVLSGVFRLLARPIE